MSTNFEENLLENQENEENSLKDLAERLSALRALTSQVIYGFGLNSERTDYLAHILLKLNFAAEDLSRILEQKKAFECENIGQINEMIEVLKDLKNKLDNKAVLLRNIQETEKKVNAVIKLISVKK